MSFDETINAYFVQTAASNDTATGNNETDLESALKYLRNHVDDEHIRQIKASEGFPLIASGKLTKKDVFIFDRFEGDFFQQLQQTKSLIIGPRCLICCVVRSEPVPLGTTPVYTTAMRDLHISATGITPQKKERLRQLIHWMGGHYFQTFGRSITHLISNTIKSTKYEHATLNGIPVMHVDWVERVWERSCVDDIAAIDEEFDKYRLPILFGTNVTCTGLTTEKKQAIMRLVNENGGTYHSAFRSQLVDIVVTDKDKTNSDKYKAAVIYKKDILLPEWIIDSVEKGFALPTKDYQVKPLKVSTPKKTDQCLADFTQLSDISRISAVGSKNKRSYNQTLNETISSGLNETQQQPQPCSSKDLQREVLQKISSAGSNYRLVYDEICPMKAKKAGNFLDGCYVYLSGFRVEEREKLNRILNVGGAVRYDVMHEKITHIIVGTMDDAEYRTWKKEGLLNTVYIVRLDWLLESIKLKQPASEIVYRMSLPTTSEPEAPSPSSKRTLRSMNNSFKKPSVPIKKKLFDQHNAEADTPIIPNEAPLASSTEVQQFGEEEHDLMAQYSQESLATAAGAPLPPVATAAEQDLTTQNTKTKKSLVQPVVSSTLLDLKEQTTSKAAAASAAVCVQPLQTNSDASAVTNITDIDYESLDFFQGMSVYIHKEKFPEDLYTQMIYECEAAQGNLVSNSYKDSVDYAIVTFITTIDKKRLPVRARHIITELYVEACLKANKLIPIEYYHKHIPSTADVQPLKGMVVNTSIYSGLERDFIGSITELLGAEMSTTFAKKERPLLVCAAAEGAKYEAARKWRYPVVDSQWLVQCAATGERLSFQPYLVGDCALDFPTSPTLRERNVTTTPQANKLLAALDNDVTKVNIAVAAANITKTPATTSQHSTPDFTPLRNKRVTELAGPSKTTRNSITTPESPHTPENNYARSSIDFEFMESILAEIENEAERETMREVIDEMRTNQTPELERIRRMACTPINRTVPTPKGIPEFCTTPAFQKRIADELERRWRLPTKPIKPDTPIEEIRKRVMRATCRVMGIPFYENDDDDKLQNQAQQQEQQLQEKQQLSPTASKTPKFTSVLKNVHTSAKTSMDTPMLQKARASKTGRSLLSNMSLNNSSSSDTYVPATQSPNATNQLSPHSGMGQRASLGKTTINFDKITFEETEVGAIGTSTVSNAKQPSTSDTLTASPEFNKIAEYLKNCETHRQSLKRSRSNSSDAKATAANEVAESEGHYVQPFESEQFGSEEVGWRDPVEFGVEKRTKIKRTMQFVGTPRFSISCDEKVRADVIQKILNLGGTVSENLVNFDTECTHFLCEKPNRGEKMIGCISSGKWILCLKYIEECYAKDVFINEELYEWGNPKGVNLPELSYDEQLIAYAAHRWRQKLTGPKKTITGAFDGIRAILHISEKHLASLINVLKAGKGEIVDFKTPFSTCESVKGITHCFVDIKKNPLKKEDYDYLQQRNVKIFSQMYINAYLMHSDDVDVNKYTIKM